MALNMTELNDLLIKLIQDLDKAHKELVKGNIDWAHKENNYRMKKALIFTTTEGTVDFRKARVDLECEQERLETHLADGVKEAAIERIKSIRAALSALQTLNHAMRIEIENLHAPEPRTDIRPF